MAMRRCPTAIWAHARARMVGEALKYAYGVVPPRVRQRGEVGDEVRPYRFVRAGGHEESEHLDLVPPLPEVIGGDHAQGGDLGRRNDLRDVLYEGVANGGVHGEDGAPGLLLDAPDAVVFEVGDELPYGRIPGERHGELVIHRSGDGELVGLDDGVGGSEEGAQIDGVDEFADDEFAEHGTRVIECGARECGQRDSRGQHVVSGDLVDGGHFVGIQFEPVQCHHLVELGGVRSEILRCEDHGSEPGGQRAGVDLGGGACEPDEAQERCAEEDVCELILHVRREEMQVIDHETCP